MANFNTFAYIKEHELSSEEIFKLLSISCPKDDYKITYEGKTIHLTSEKNKIDILFDSNYYIVTKTFSSYTYREWHSYQDFIMHKESVFNNNDDRFVFEQLYNPYKPNEIIRIVSLLEKDQTKGTASFKKYINKGRMFGHSETFKETRGKEGIRRIRVIDDPANIIITNYHTFVEPLYRNPIVGKTISTCSIYPPSTFTTTIPVSNPDQLYDLSDYDFPVIKIVGNFIDASTIAGKKEDINELRYELLIVKTPEKIESVITIKDKNGKQSYITICPSDECEFCPEDINEIIANYNEIAFLEHGSEFPLEKRVIEELKKIKEDIFTHTYRPELGVDFFDFNLTQNNDYEHMAFQIYENLQTYCDKAKEHRDVKKIQK